MKRLLLLYTIVFAVNLAFVMSVVRLVGAVSTTPDEFAAYYSFSGISKFKVNSPELDTSSPQYAGGEDTVMANNVIKADFSPFSAIYTSSNDLLSKELPKADDRLALYLDTDMSSVKVDEDMVYHNTFKELPLFPVDYYSGKYTNAVAGVRQLNRMPVMKPGESVSVIGDRYMVITSQNGYVKPPHYVYGSGVCWSTSVLGAMLDDANVAFKAKYGVDLVVYRSGDRAPHGGYYPTYTNNHHGYTVLQKAVGVAVQDYTFRVNPQIKNIPGMADLKIKIVLVNTNKHPTGVYGESIGAYIISNKEF
jgi:hypothetical protein